MIWADWQSCSSSREELLDPVRSQYKEAFVVVRCSFEGQTFSRCVYIWVDKDFAIGRGIHQGYPKKLGSMWQTRPHPFPQGAPQIGPGGAFGATLASGDRRLAEAVLTLRAESETNGFVNAHKMAHHRIFRYVGRIDQRLIWLNLLFLMCVAFIPFPTGVLGDHDGSRGAIVFYAATICLTGTVLASIWQYLIHAGHLNERADAKIVRYLTRRSLVTPISFLVSIPLSFVSLRLAEACWFAPFVLIGVINARHGQS